MFLQPAQMHGLIACTERSSRDLEHFPTDASLPARFDQLCRAAIRPQDRRAHRRTASIDQPGPVPLPGDADGKHLRRIDGRVRQRLAHGNRNRLPHGLHVRFRPAGARREET